jgi:hypothetical protein
MSEEMIVTDRAGESLSDEASDVAHDSELNRRNFLQYAIAAASGLAITSMLPSVGTTAWAVSNGNN